MMPVVPVSTAVKAEKRAVKAASKGVMKGPPLTSNPLTLKLMKAKEAMIITASTSTAKADGEKGYPRM